MAISNPTPKQVRNGSNTGAPGSGATTAKPGPDATREITSVKGQAERVMDRRMRETVNGLLQTPAGSGMGGHEVGANGDMYQWDSGLAINDVEGGGSG